MAIKIHPHASLRMEERGATLIEVIETIEAGRSSEAKFGRIRYEMTFLCAGSWQGLYYSSKHLDVLCAIEGADIIVITVVVKYSQERIDGH